MPCRSQSNWPLSRSQMECELPKKSRSKRRAPENTHTHTPTHKDTTQQKTGQRKVYSNFGNSRGRIFSKKDCCRIFFFFFWRKKFKKIMTKFCTFTGVHCTPPIPLADKEWQRKSYRTYLSFFSPLVLVCVVVCLFVCLPYTWAVRSFLPENKK